MALEFEIVGEKGKDSTKSAAHVHPFKTATGTHQGVVALTQNFIDTEPITKFFTNITVGIAINQDVSFGSIASVIHDGGTTSNADSGTADTNTLNHVIQAGQNFLSTCVVGMFITGTNKGHITAVNSNTDLTCSADICPNGNEAFTVNAVWSGTAVAGTWNFSDSNKFTLTSGNNGDEASIDADIDAAYDMNNFTAFTGKVDLDIYDPAFNDFFIQFDEDGVAVGNSVLLNTYINTEDFSEQTFVIPKADLGLSNQTLNGLTLRLVRTGGPKPTVKFDDFQLESSGTPLVYSLNVNPGDSFHIEELVFTYKDNINSFITVANGTEQATAKLLDPDRILGLAQLINGFVINRKKGGNTLFSATIKDLGSHIAAGARITELITAPDGSSTQVTLRAEFKRDLILTGDADDTLTITINDDMSTLERFTCAARGGLETS